MPLCVLGNITRNNQIPKKVFEFHGTLDPCTWARRRAMDEYSIYNPKSAIFETVDWSWNLGFASTSHCTSSTMEIRIPLEVILIQGRTPKPHSTVDVPLVRQNCAIKTGINVCRRRSIRNKGHRRKDQKIGGSPSYSYLARTETGNGVRLIGEVEF